MIKKYAKVIFFCVVFSFVSGVLSHDVFIGGLNLFTALLCAYFSCEGKRISYLLGFINYLLIGFVSFQNQLYGLFLFSVIVCPILQIQGYISWGKHLNEEKNVKVRSFTFKNSILITLSCVLGSFLLSYLLAFIPRQRLSFMDASSNIINLCAVILGVLRFKECWWIWLVNNCIDLGIWIITFVNKGEGSTMMLLVSIGYLLINIYGIIKWTLEAKRDI